MAGRYDIEGRTVLITGAARGIGADAAARLHAKGANVALVGLEPERLHELAERLGDRTAWYEADVTDLGVMERVAADTAQRFGGIDVAIASAGVHAVGAVATTSVEEFERQLMVNLFGVWRTDRAVLPYVTERRGYVLNIASAAAASHTALSGAYAASKAGVEALTNVLRQELAPSGTRVGCAYFGVIDTDMPRDSLAHPAMQAAAKLAPPFVRKAVPLSQASDAIEDGIARRRARVWAPRYVGGVLAFRWWIQQAIDLRASRGSVVAEALRLADPAAGLAGRAAVPAPVAVGRSQKVRS